MPSSVPYEEECSTVTSSPDGTKINEYQEKKLKIEQLN